MCVLLFHGVEGWMWRSRSPRFEGVKMGWPGIRVLSARQITLIVPVAVVAILISLTSWADSGRSFSVASTQGRRVALVVGNGNYANTTKLPNPANDAAAVGEALKRLGFDVKVQTDLNKRDMEESLRNFGDRLRGATAAVFYYSGHGLQVDGVNYLVPTDAKLQQERDLNYDVLSVDIALKEMEAEKRVNLIFLNACRDNPLASNLARSMGKTRSSAVGQGLAPLKNAAVGTLIAYATREGNVAADGEGKNSPFTQAILAHIEEEGVEVSMLLRRVREDVMRQTNERQVPWEYGSMLGEFYFNSGLAPYSGSQTSRIQRAEDTRPTRTDDTAVELLFWESVEKSKMIEGYKAYASKYPQGQFTELARIKIAELTQRTVTAKAVAPQSFVEKSDNGRFVKAVMGVINDSKTGLQWLPGPDDAMVWEDAKRWVSNQTVDGGGWRMPTRAELTAFNPSLP